jgi:hypothetical protein
MSRSLDHPALENSAAGCPAAADLARFAVGDLSSGALARTAEHVERCSACQTALGRPPEISYPV